VKDRDFNIRRYHIDDHHLASLGWSPQVDLDIFKKTVNWYLKHQNWYGDIESVLVAF
jgi:dTDP-D-glucose 4,6-dehydratase